MVLYICFILFSIIYKSHQHLLEALDDNALNKLLMESSWPIRFKSKPYLDLKSGLLLPEVNSLSSVFRRIRYNGQSNIDGKLGEVIFLTTDHKFQEENKHRSKSTVSNTKSVYKPDVIINKKYTGNTQGFMKRSMSDLVPSALRGMANLKKREINTPMFRPRQQKTKHLHMYRIKQTDKKTIPPRSGFNRSPLWMYYRKQKRFPSYHRFNPLTAFAK